MKKRLHLGLTSLGFTLCSENTPILSHFVPPYVTFVRTRFRLNLRLRDLHGVSVAVFTLCNCCVVVGLNLNVSLFSHEMADTTLKSVTDDSKAHSRAKNRSVERYRRGLSDDTTVGVSNTFT